MNNENTKENQRIDATPDKQLIRYNKNGKPEFGIRFIYQADNAKLVYSRGRIFLIFAHYNVFYDDWVGHNADTVATFSDDLGDVDFGIVWGASHSLIQSATFDENYFWSATLSDAYPQGIRVEYTSKREFLNNYDAVAKKNNIRVNDQDDSLAGIIKGYYYGWADGKLGAILYFDKLELYCLVYAKTPNYSSDEKNNKNIIYITTWKFINGKIEQTTFKEIKVLEKGNIMQVRAGKLGDNEVFITYLHTNSSGHNYYGNIPRGSSPKVFVVKLPNFELIKNDETDNYLVINKIGLEPAPSVTWKDAYGLEKDKKTEEGKEINSAKINLRGITSDQITDAHSFFIYLILRLISGIRLLEGEESSDIKIKATCTKKNIEGNDINLVDYECVGDAERDLTDYNLVNIEEGDSDNSLKTSNLNTLIDEIITNNNDADLNLNQLLTKDSSSFTLDNTAIFKMNEAISKLQASDFKFSFKIEGTLDKSLALEGNSINIEFELREADAKANCILEIGESNQASLSCELNVEEYTNINEFSFKSSEFKQDSNEIYFSKLNEISLINNDNMIYPKENNNNNKEDDDDGNKTVIIVVSVICSVIGAVGIGIGLYFILKKLKAKKINYTAKETMGQQTVKTEEIVGSENRVIKYNN